MGKENDCTCINCKEDFKSYKKDYECPDCEDGSEEIEHEFGDGSEYRQCRTCNGTGAIVDTEYCFCSDECFEDMTQ